MSNAISEQDPIDLFKLQERLSVVESELADIRNRNRPVESDKAWETSRGRLLSITGITYATMVLGKKRGRSLCVLSTPPVPATIHPCRRL